VDSYTTAMLGAAIEANSPQYAVLAQMLGQLGVTVIAVTHANKSSAKDGQPRLSDVAGSGALGALAQTALVVHYPIDNDKNRVTVGCARAPETGFASFDVLFADTLGGEGLAVTIAPAQDVPAVEPREAARLADRLAKASHNADRIEQLLRDVDTLGAGMTPQKIRGALSLVGVHWAEARAECKRRGTIAEASLPSDKDVRLRLTGPSAEAAAPPLPVVGSVARAGRGVARPAPA
jgi:hypothetical protein